MAKVEEKKVVIDQIKEKLEGANSIVLVDYRGLTVEQDTQIRKSMREAGVEYRVFKNTMMSFAFKDTQFDELRKHLGGPSAIAISYDDATAGPRTLNNLAKEFEALEFKAGVVDGNYYDKAEIEAVAGIAPREELLAKLFGSFKSPIASFARVIKAVADQKAEGTEAAE